MFTTYVIINEQKRTYTGHTANLTDRLARHRKELPSKKTSFTHKNGSDWKLLYQENFETRQEAVKREKELKSYQGRQFIKSIIV